MSTNDLQRILALIPARGGSKGLQHKNLLPTLGKPLIAYTIDAARHCSLISDVLVTTDSDDIEHAARVHGARTYRHPAELSEDGRATFPVIKHVVSELHSKGEDYSLIAVLRATSPLRSSEDIAQAIGLLLETGADSVVSVVADPTGHPIRLKTIDAEGKLVSLHPGEEDYPIIRQNLPIVYRRNGAVYIARPQIIMSGSLFGKDSRAYVMPKHRSVNINDEVDHLLAVALLSAQKSAATASP